MKITSIRFVLLLILSFAASAAFAQHTPPAMQPGISIAEWVKAHGLDSSLARRANGYASIGSEATFSRPAHTLSNTFTVTNTSNSGTGSLAWAIDQVNAAGGGQISFSIGTGPQTIQVQGNLPFISTPVILDATTQPGYSGKPIIELDGASSDDYGLRVEAGPSTIKGLVINRFPLGGIVLGNPPQSADDNITVASCYIGTDVSGTMALPNGGGTNSSPDEGGIILYFSGNDIIGGTTPGSGNLVSGNNGPGITITGNGNTGSQLYGNYVGTTASGLAALPNQGAGLELDGNTNFQTIGSDTVRGGNLFSGNNGDGILLYHLTTGPNRIRGNVIGETSNEQAQLPNGGAGIFVDASNDNTIGQADSVYSNTISGDSYAVRLDSGATGNIIEGNSIATDTTVVGTIGVYVKSSTDNTIGSVGAANTISQNRIGIMVESCTSVSIRGNSIFSNTTTGIRLTSSGNNLQPAPRLDSAIADSAITTLYGALQAAPNSSYTIDVYANGRCDPSGFGEGYDLLISSTVTTNASGLAPLHIAIPHTGADSALAALATDANGNTSQFSNCLCCPIVRIPFSPVTNGFAFGNSQSNMWPSSFTDTIDYTEPRYAGLDSILKNLGTSAHQTDFPSWDLWASAFGNNAVYLSTSPSVIYKARAVQLWNNRKQPNFGGACYGFSLSSLLESAVPTTFPQSFLGLPADASYLIDRYFCYQFSAEGGAYEYPSGTPALMVDSLRRSMKRNPLRYQTLAVFTSDNSSAHQVVPYKITCGTSTISYLPGEVDSVFVYDCNHPLDTTRAVLVYRNDPNGFWTYPPYLGYGKGFVPDVEVGTFANGTLPTLPNMAAPQNGKFPIVLATDPSANLYFADSAFVSVQDQTGHSITTLDSLTGTIPGCAYMIPRTGGVTEIQGFHFDSQDTLGWTVTYRPEDTAQMNYLDAANSSLSMDANFSQADTTGAKHFAVNLPNQSLGLRAESASQNFGLSLIWDGDVGENSLNLTNSSLSPNDSAWFQLDPATNYLAFRNMGTAKNYSLALRRATAAREVNERFGAIAIGANAAHTLKVASWDSLATTAITIDVDRQNNGTTDSVIVLQQYSSNVAPDANSMAFVSVNPNPFRDATTFELSLARPAMVTLTIIDALGRTIATIVNEMLPNGTSQFQWNAETLPSGVYFYRFQTGGQIETGKLVLIE